MKTTRISIATALTGAGLALMQACASDSTTLGTMHDSPSGAGGQAASGGSLAAGRGGSGGSGGSGAGGVQARGGANATGGSAAGNTSSAGTDPGSGGDAPGGGLSNGGSGGEAQAGQTGSGGADAGAGGSTAGSGTGGGAGFTACGMDCEQALFDCCGDHCVNTKDDPFNCGLCGTRCEGGTPICLQGSCVAQTCNSADTCPPVGSGEPRTCCGDVCCRGTTLCCAVPGPIAVGQLGCYEPSENEGTCPRGCNTCRCAAPDTPIATPRGDVPIAELAVGDVVYSVEGNAIVAVPIRAIHREPILTWHSVTEVTLANGAVLDISRGHPTGDGRTFADLRPGDRLGEMRVVAVNPNTPYRHPFTHDILPASSTGAYFAAGALVGSTLASGASDF